MPRSLNASMLLIGLALSATACPGSFCDVPTGSYALRVGSSSGDCPASVVDAISQQLLRQPLVVSSDNDACGGRQVEVMASDPQSGCDVLASGRAPLDDLGLSEFDMTLEVSGQDCRAQCEQLVRVLAEQAGS